MEQSEYLRHYLQEVEEIRKQAKAWNLKDDEINQIFKECFDEMEKEEEPHRRKSKKFVCKTAFVILAVLLGCYVLLYVHQPTSSIVLRNVQGLIYPGLKLVRFLSMPVIKYMPSLTELYDESCLLTNPYFYVNNMECWPCENIHSVINLTNNNNSALYETESPFIVKYDQKVITLKDIQQMYSENKQVFDNDANRIRSTLSNLSETRDLLHYEPNLSSDVHVAWRINRMLPARIIRKLFPKPKFISEWSGQSIERFVMIDEPFAQGYSLPDFECGYVFVIQGSGERTIVLKPSRECAGSCRTLSIVLKPTYILRYNWWYWRPISLPVENSSTVSISYINSYC